MSNNEVFNGSGKHFSGAPVESVFEKILWEARITILESECNVSKNTPDGTDSNINDITTIVDRIKSEIHSSVTEENAYMLEHALAEVVLYQAQKSFENSSHDFDANGQMKLASTLEGLPESIRLRPAVIATLYSIYSNLSMDEKIKETLDSMNSGGDANQSLTEQKRMGDFKLRLGMYEEAASIYESILSQMDDGDDTLNDDERMECEAGLMKATSYFDPAKAIELADELPLEFEDLDGEELEAMEIPRLSKGSSGSKMRKMLGRKTEK